MRRMTIRDSAMIIYILNIEEGRHPKKLASRSNWEL